MYNSGQGVRVTFAKKDHPHPSPLPSRERGQDAPPWPPLGSGGHDGLAVLAPPARPFDGAQDERPLQGMGSCLRRNDEGLGAGMIRFRRTGSPQEGGGVEGASTLTVLSGDSYNRADPLSLISRVQFIE